MFSYETDKSIFSGNSDLICPPEVVSAFAACAIGGNSAINAGLYFQPPASDWDEYFPAGWHSEDVKSATAKLRETLPPVTKYSTDDKFYLQSGYNAAKTWLVGEANFTEVDMDDVPDEKQRVFGRPVYDYIGGQRGGPAVTYLQNASARKNFHLQTGASVQHIVQTNGAASGVVVNVGGKQKTIKLSGKGRVVVSAGAIITPQILMYSGIGPKDTLTNLTKKANNPYKLASSWVVNNAVGKGLFDNPNTFIELSAPSVEAYAFSYDEPLTSDRELFLTNRSGPYTFASQTSVFWDYIPHDDGSRTGVQGTIDSSGFSDFTDENTITLNIYGTSGMLSSGRVILSTDGKFTPGASSDVYYSKPRDARSIATFIHSIFQALPASTPKGPAKTGLTPLNIARGSSVDEIYKYITSSTAYTRGQTQHWSSSCRIGKCVDVNTKVIGTKNIHVIDASIVSPLTVNPQFGVMVAAEKGAERILATWS